MFSKKLLSWILLLASAGANAQFAPQAPLPGNDAVPVNDIRIRSWATGCTVTRGWKNISDTTQGKATTGTGASVTGAADGDVLSLGDKGHALLTFDHPIRNGEGPDFAVFENGFPNPLDASMAYLEFAFVEVSSDGIHFSRFPAVSNTQDSLQIDNFTYMDAGLVHNLAGKYINGYGTPFDLEELKNEPDLDVDNIRFVRIADVVGSIDSTYASFDRNGHIINDPFPSPYPSGGFDLDAVAVLNQDESSGIASSGKNPAIQVFPNPAHDFINIKTDGMLPVDYMCADLCGRIMTKGTCAVNGRIDVSGLAAGIYFLSCTNGRETRTIKIKVD